MKAFVYLILTCLITTRSMAACEIRVNNQSDNIALALVHYDNDLKDNIHISPHHSLFVNLYYGGYCHDKAYFQLYRNYPELYFSGPLYKGQSFDINPPH